MKWIPRMRISTNTESRTTTTELTELTATVTTTELVVYLRGTTRSLGLVFKKLTIKNRP